MPFCSALSRPFFLICALLSGMILSAQVRVSPQGGMNRFQDSLLQHHDSLRLFLDKQFPVIASYEFRLNRKGLIQDIRLTDQFSLSKKADIILRGALKVQKWNHLTRQERKSACTVVFWFKPETAVGDTANRTDSTLISRDVKDENDEEDPRELKNQEARHPGGEQAKINLIIQHLNFPDECRKKSHEGYVQLRFCIKPDGSVAQISVVNESTGCPEFKRSIQEIIKNSEPWIPAVQNGMIITAWRELPVRISVE